MTGQFDMYSVLDSTDCLDIGNKQNLNVIFQANRLF